jgi:hypothetical protein
VKRDAVEVAAAEVEALEREIWECRKRGILASAELCSSVGRHFSLMKALPDDGELCTQRARAAYSLEDDLETCAEFHAVPADLGFTKEELRTVMAAVDVERTISHEALVAQASDIYWACLRTSERLRR